MRGYANPDSALIDLKDGEEVSEMADLGPAVHHYYEVTNFGPYDIGNVIVNLSWPLKSSEGLDLLYLTDTPFIKYFSGGREWQEECFIDPTLINPRQLSRGRVRREGEVLEYPEGSDEVGGIGIGGMVPPVFELEYDEADYNYDHLEEEVNILTLT